MMINSAVYAEVFEILKYMDKTDVMKIPVEILTKIKDYNQQETQQEYDIDEVGNMTEKDAFQRDYSQQGVDIDYGY